MEAGGPRSQGLGACLEKEPFLTDLKLERPCCQEVCPKVNSSQRRCLLQNTEPGCEPGNRRVSPGEGALPGSGGLQVLFIPALEAWALNGPPPPPGGPPQFTQPSPSAFWSLLLGWAAPGPRATLHLHASFPGAQASPPQGQAPPLPSTIVSAGRATAQMLRATPDLFLSEE